MKPARRARNGLQDDVDQEREDRGRRHAGERGEDHRLVQRPVDAVGDQRSERHHVAVREIDEPQDPVDQRDAERGDRVDRPRDQTVREQLQEHVRRAQP